MANFVASDYGYGSAVNLDHVTSATVVYSVPHYVVQLRTVDGGVHPVGDRYETPEDAVAALNKLVGLTAPSSRRRPAAK